MTRPAAVLRWIVCAVAAIAAAPAIASENASANSCRSQIETARIVPAIHLAIPTGGAAEASVVAPRGRRILVEAAEQHVDLLLEAGDESRPPPLRADTPIRRAGTIHAIYVSTSGYPLHVRLSIKEHPKAAGTATLGLFDLDSNAIARSCLTHVEMMAAGDADYSIGEDIATGRYPRGAQSSKHAYLRATEEYLAAYHAASAEPDARDRTLAALSQAATFYQGVKDWQRTSEWGLRARDVAAGSGDPYLAARASFLNAAGWIESPGPPAAAKESGELDAHTRLTRVRKQLSDLAAFHRNRHEYYDEGSALTSVGLAFEVEGAYAEAFRTFENTARLFRRLGEPTREGHAIQNMAWNEWGLGDLASAERHFRQGLELTRPDTYRYMTGMSSLADLEQAIGNLDSALQLQTETLRLAEQLQLRLPIEHNLYSLGATYYAIGDLDQSTYYLERAVRYSRLDPYAQAIDLRALAAAYRDSGRRADARRAANAALALAYSKPARARMEIAIATDDAALGHIPEAMNRLATILAGPSTGWQDVRVEALIARAQIERLDHRTSEAVADLMSALKALKSVESPADEYLGNLELARAQLLLGQLPEAKEAAERALVLGQYLRRQTANPALRAQRQEPLRPAYDVKVSVLMAMRRDNLRQGEIAAARARELEALTTVESSRAQALRDFASVDYSNSAEPSIARDLRRRAELYRSLGFKLGQLDSRTDAAGDDDPSVLQARSAVSALRRELDALDSRIAARTGRSGPNITPVPKVWSGWLARHAPDALILEYWLGEDAAYCWAIDRSGVQLFELGDGHEIDRAARVMHSAMRAVVGSPSGQRIDAASMLSNLIVRPLGGVVASRRRLIIVPDQALAYVSFPALVVGRSKEPTYLVETHDIAIAPAAWWLFRDNKTRSTTVDGGILIIADPVYQKSDNRRPNLAEPKSSAQRDRSVALPPLSRLPLTHREADAIASQFPDGMVHRLEGLAATRSRFLTEPLSHFRYIHIASHGLVDSRMPQMASLILSEYDENGSIAEPSIRTADLMSLDLHADVVALSACETALGRGVIGEGSMGLGYAALARGAHAVVASLWSVTDEISADVMTELYGALRERHEEPAAALADAMRSMLKKRPGLDPAYWAAFQLTLSDPPEWAPDRSKLQ